jgi:hypothetical protein
MEVEILSKLGTISLKHARVSFLPVPPLSAPEDGKRPNFTKLSDVKTRKVDHTQYINTAYRQFVVTREHQVVRWAYCEPKEKRAPLS